jgi:anti-anti-sigma factor
MPIEFEKDAGSIKFIFEGRMDTLGSNSVSQEIEKVISEIGNDELAGLRISFDLLNVDFVSSAFMRICLKYAKKVSPGNLELLNTDLNIKKTFKIAGLDKVLKIL